MMKRHLAARFWFEAVTAAPGLILFVMTLITREWIEVSRVGTPDGGSGSLEITAAA